jgi:hypothetical protein
MTGDPPVHTVGARKKLAIFAASDVQRVLAALFEKPLRARWGIFRLHPIPGPVIAKDTSHFDKVIEVIIVDDVVGEIVVTDQNAHGFLSFC